MPPFRFVSFVAGIALWGSLASAQSNATAQDLDVANAVEMLTQSGQNVVQVDAGVTHACALVQSGRVYCWGFGSFGQLGSDTISSNVPVLVKRLGNIKQISVGRNHSCALQRSGRVFCWGRNDAGQLGNGSTDNSSIRVRVQAAPNAVDISVGNDHSCMVMRNGRAFCWGNNRVDQLGLGPGGGSYSLRRNGWLAQPSSIRYRRGLTTHAPSGLIAVATVGGSRRLSVQEVVGRKAQRGC